MIKCKTFNEERKATERIELDFLRRSGFPFLQDIIIVKHRQLHFTAEHGAWRP